MLRSCSPMLSFLISASANKLIYFLDPNLCLSLLLCFFNLIPGLFLIRFLVLSAAFVTLMPYIIRLLFDAFLPVPFDLSCISLTIFVLILLWHSMHVLK